MRLDQYSLGSYTPGASLLKQVLWLYLGDFLVQTPWLPFSSAKVAILRLFGAKIGTGIRIKPHVKIKFPWRLTLHDYIWLGEYCWIDNVAEVVIESHVCISQNVYLCTGNHDWSDPDFALTPKSIYLETGSWLGANAIVGPGVRVRQGAVLGLGAVATHSLEAMTIYMGNPCQPIKQRIVRDSLEGSAFS